MKPRTPKNFNFPSPESEGKYNNRRNANYDFESQTQPYTRMGEDDHAGMPREPVMKDFSTAYEYRDGIINSFDASVSDISNIRENRR